VVFDTALDLKAHTVEDHGGDMSSRDKKDARRVHADFAFEDVGGRHGHGRRDRDRERERGERDRDPPPQAPPPPRQQQAQVSLSSAATTAPPPGNGARRREAFGGGLTQAGEAENNSRGISRPSTPQATAEVDQAVIEYLPFFLHVEYASL
jgi:E3 ubiquitin-protein ligase ZNF598